MKKSSSRGQRGSKGIRGKHILQICVLLSICIWLIYQVKYSHEKKKEFYEKDGKKSTELLEGVDGLVKLGRKDLPGYEVVHQERHVEDEDDEEIGGGEEKKEKEKENKSKLGNGNHEEEEEKEEEEEEEEVEEEEEDKNKQVEEDGVDEEDNKHGEEDEREDVIDEQDQSRIEDTEKDDELLEEEKENGSSERDVKAVQRVEKDSNVDENDMSIHEAREEHYKADDASSAVSHESRVLNTEKQNENSGYSNVTSQVEIEKEPVLKSREAESADLVDQATTDGDSDSSSSDQTETKTIETELKDEVVNRNLTMVSLEASGFVQNETEISQAHDKLEDVAPLARSSDPQIVDLQQPSHESDPNITVSANITRNDFIHDEFKNLTSESTVNENISGTNTTMVTKNSESEAHDESDEKESSNLDSVDQTEETEDTSETRISMEEREALTDPLTLPDIRTEENEEEEEALGAE